MRTLVFASALVTLTLAGGCRGRHARTPGVDPGPVPLRSVVLYRNGVALYERKGTVYGTTLELSVRRDHIDDLLKSITVLDEGGRPVSVSIPQDVGAWHEVARAALESGDSASLAGVLERLRGTEVVLHHAHGRTRGRLMTIEPWRRDAREDDEPVAEDHRLTLLDGHRMRVVALSSVVGITLREGDFALSLHRHLDALEGEGLFARVGVTIRFSEGRSRDVTVQYIAPAPVWKPTYRVVLPDVESDTGLLQAWAVVDNISGEDWRSVDMALSAGAPLSFRYGLRDPQYAPRQDLTHIGRQDAVEVALGDEVMASEPAALEAVMPEAAADADMVEEMEEARYAGKKKSRRSRARPGRARELKPGAGSAGILGGSAARPASAPPPPPPAVARALPGQTRFELTGPVTVPDGSSALVRTVHATIPAQHIAEFRPNAGGRASLHPYRALKLKNTTDFLLEPGPMAVHAEAAFLGEGLSQSIAAGATATIPFALDETLMVEGEVNYGPAQQRILRIRGGVIEVERRSTKVTTWKARRSEIGEVHTVWVRHARAGDNWKLVSTHKDHEEIRQGWLIPVRFAPKAMKAKVEVREETPSRVSLQITSPDAPKLLKLVLEGRDLNPKVRAKLEPIVKLRVELARLDEVITELQAQRRTLDQRADQTRQNLKAIKKDGAASGLRKRLSQRLEEFTREADRLARQVVEHQARRLELKIELDDALADIDLRL